MRSVPNFSRLAALIQLGAVVANTLLYADDRPRKVVVLEAREICSGASGRNAGHCRPGERSMRSEVWPV